MSMNIQEGMHFFFQQMHHNDGDGDGNVDDDDDHN